MTLVRPATLLLLLVLPAAALAFWGKKTDEERLKSKLDSLKVHLYLTGKAAVAKTAHSDEAKALKDSLLAVGAGAARTVEGLQEKEAEPVAAQESSVKLSLKEVAGLGKALWDMRAVGKQVLGDDKNALPPVLPVLLAPLGVSPELVSRLDRPTDHAALFVALALVKLHPDLPVPLAPELILYEGSRTVPEQVKVPGFAQPLYALKAYTLAMSELCDLAHKEVKGLEALGASEAAQLGAGLKLLTSKEVALSPEQVGAVDSASRALAQGSLALCFQEREQWKEAQVALSQFLDTAEQAGVEDPELHKLRASVNSKEPQAMGKLINRVRLGKLIARVAWAHLQRSGLFEALGEQEWVKRVGEFITTLGQGISKVPGSLQVSLGGDGWD